MKTIWLCFYAHATEYQDGLKRLRAPVAQHTPELSNKPARAATATRVHSSGNGGDPKRRGRVKRQTAVSCEKTTR